MNFSSRSPNPVSDKSNPPSFNSPSSRRSSGRGGASQAGACARLIGVPGAASGLEATGGELLISYTKFTFKEFRVCARAWFAFGAGYKLGERYRLGELERRHGQSADPEAWQLGYELSTRRYEKAYGAN